MKKRKLIAPYTVSGRWWHRLDDERIECDLCPRYCRLALERSVKLLSGL